MNEDQKRDLIEALQRCGLPYTEASDFVNNPRQAVEKMEREIMQILTARVLTLEQNLKEQQKQIGELSAKVWRLQNR